MKWFKHESTALKDEAIQSLMDKEGPLGYAIYFMICELCAEKIDENLNCEVRMSWPYVEKLTHCRRATVRRVLDSCRTAALLTDNSTQNEMICSIPNLLKRLDNWTQRYVVTTEQVSTNKNKKENKNIEIEEEYTQAFLSFWNTYPRKKAKGYAYKAWQKLNPDLEVVLKALEKAKQSADWLKEGGQFIPHPASWLNAKGWEDDYEPGIGESEYDRFKRIAEQTK